MIDPSVKDLADMIELAIMASNKPPKAVALELKCSLSTVYQSMTGKRSIPVGKMRRFAETNLIAAASMALQSTGLAKLFRYRKSDRHIQARLLELKIYDKRSDDEMNKLPELLFNKNTAKDLSESDKQVLLAAVSSMIDRDNVALNLFMELDTRYQLDLVEHIKKAHSDKFQNRLGIKTKKHL